MSVTIEMTIGQSGEQPEERTPFWVHCTKCPHEWVAAYLPMPVATFSKIGKSLRCPMCGSTKVNCDRQPTTGHLLKPEAATSHRPQTAGEAAVPEACGLKSEASLGEGGQQ